MVVFLAGRSVQVCQHRRAFETKTGEVIQLPNESLIFIKYEECYWYRVHESFTVIISTG